MLVDVVFQIGRISYPLAQFVVKIDESNLAILTNLSDF
jgi:hypothetical protein